MSLPLGIAIIPGSVAAAAVQTNVRVEKARSLPVLSCAITEGFVEPLVEAAWETVWSVGAALPALAQSESKREEWSDEFTLAQDLAPANGESPWTFAQALINSGYPLERVQDRLVREKGLTEADARLLLADVEQPSVAAPDDSPAAEAAQDVTRTGLNLGPVLGLGIMVVSLAVAAVLPTPVTLLTAVIGLVLGVATGQKGDHFHRNHRGPGTIHGRELKMWAERPPFCLSRNM